MIDEIYNGVEDGDRTATVSRAMEWMNGTKWIYS